MELEFSWQTFEKWAYSDIKFHVNPSRGSRAVLRGWIDMTKKRIEKASSDISVTVHYSKFPVACMGGNSRGHDFYKDCWGTILAFFNLAIQSLVCLSGCWRQVVRGKASDFTFWRMACFSSMSGVCFVCVLRNADECTLSCSESVE